MGDGRVRILLDSFDRAADGSQFAGVLAVVGTDHGAVYKEIQVGLPIQGTPFHLFGGRSQEGGHRFHDGHLEVDGKEMGFVILERLPPAAAEIGHHRHIRPVHPRAEGHFH